MAKKADTELLKFTKEQLEDIVPALVEYLDDEMDVELSGLQGQLLLRYITQNIGKYYYNKAIDDAIAMMSSRVDDLYTLTKL